MLAEVIEYTRTHFRDEERAMKATRCAAFAAHKAAHDADWFMQHIREMDQSYAPHMKSAGIH